MAWHEWQNVRRSSVPNPIRRRSQLEQLVHTDRICDGLIPTPKLSALSDRYLAGEISLDEYTETIRRFRRW
jgi:uncharacterized membrane protein